MILLDKSERKEYNCCKIKKKISMKRYRYQNSHKRVSRGRNFKVTHVNPRIYNEIHTPSNLLIQNTILIRYNTKEKCRPSSVGRALGC